MKILKAVLLILVFAIFLYLIISFFVVPKIVPVTTSPPWGSRGGCVPNNYSGLSENLTGDQKSCYLQKTEKDCESFKVTEGTLENDGFTGCGWVNPL